MRVEITVRTIVERSECLDIEDLADELDMSVEDATEAVKDWNDGGFTSGAEALEQWAHEHCEDWTSGLNPEHEVTDVATFE